VAKANTVRVAAMFDHAAECYSINRIRERYDCTRSPLTSAACRVIASARITVKID